MSIAATRSSTRTPWELVLLGVLVLSLALIPVRIHQAFGLPAHPLLLHVPVVFVPIASVAALALAARPDWLLRFGLALGVLSVLTTAATILTVGAGQAFRADRESELGPAPIGGRLDQHAEAGERLRLAMVGFTLVLLLAAYVARTRREDGAAALVLRGLLAVLAVLALFLVVRTGHLGAELAWSDPA